MAAMAAQLVPCSPSVPPSTHRGHREGEALLGAGQGTRSKLALCPGWVAQEPGGAGREPRTRQGHIRDTPGTQAPHSSPSFTSPGIHKVPAQQVPAALQDYPLSLLPVPLHQAQPTIPLCVPRTRAGPWLLPAKPISAPQPLEQPLSPSPLRTLLQSHSLGAKGENKSQPQLPGAGGSSGLLLLSQTEGGKKAKAACGVG